MPPNTGTLFAMMLMTTLVVVVWIGSIVTRTRKNKRCKNSLRRITGTVSKLDETGCTYRTFRRQGTKQVYPMEITYTVDGREIKYSGVEIMHNVVSRGSAVVMYFNPKDASAALPEWWSITSLC